MKKTVEYFDEFKADLIDATYYELNAINYLRSCLYGQNEKAGSGISFVVGDLTDDGNQKKTTYFSARIDVSGDAVRHALNTLRPLAFVAAFKVQDLIVEWILKANGIKVWQFQKKITEYSKLNRDSSFIQPPLFLKKPNIANAFWSLYKNLVPLRSAIIHSGGLVLEADGTISITKHDTLAQFSTADQGAYMRAMCILTKLLTGLADSSDFLEDVVHASLYSLKSYHDEKELPIRRARLESLTIYVPPNFVKSYFPLIVEIDFRHAKEVMEESFEIKKGVHLYYSVKVVVKDRCNDDSKYFAIWEIPLEAVPVDLIILKQGDHRFDSFLRFLSI